MITGTWDGDPISAGTRTLTGTLTRVTKGMSKENMAVKGIETGLEAPGLYEGPPDAVRFAPAFSRNTASESPHFGSGKVPFLW